MKGLTADRRTVRAVGAMLFCVVLAVALCGCDVKSKQTDNGGTDSAQLEGGGRLAPSLKAYAAQLLSEHSSSMSDVQRSAVERVSRTGEAPVSDYENAISGYRQCMLALGYKEIVFLEVGGGLKEEAMHRSGTKQQEEKYAQDSADCWFAHGAGIAHLYETQVGNPSLLSDPMEAIVDCLKRKKLVAVSYSAEQLKEERVKARKAAAGGDMRWLYSFKDSAESYACRAANGWISADSSDPVEQLW